MAKKKGLKIFLIIVIIFVVLLIAAGTALFFTWKYYKDKYDNGENFDVLSYRIRNYEYDEVDNYNTGNGSTASGITQIYIDWAFGKVTLESYDGDEFKFEESGVYSKDDELIWYEEGVNLYLNYRKSGKAIYKGDNFAKDLHFYVPASKMDSALLIDVWTVSADIDYINLNLGDIDTVTESGKTTSTNLIMNSGSFETKTGDIDIEINCKDTDFAVDSANVTLRLPEEEGFYLMWNTDTGKLDSEFVFDPEEEYGGGTYKNQTHTYKMNTTSGNCKLVKAKTKTEE